MKNLVDRHRLQTQTKFLNKEYINHDKVAGFIEHGGKIWEVPKAVVKYPLMGLNRGLQYIPGIGKPLSYIPAGIEHGATAVLSLAQNITGKVLKTISKVVTKGGEAIVEPALKLVKESTVDSVKKTLEEKKGDLAKGKAFRDKMKARRSAKSAKKAA